MLFSSELFIFIFLPAALAGFYLIRRFIGGTGALSWIVFASIAFYAVWNPPYVLLLTGSIGINFLFARQLSKQPSAALLTVAVVSNLVVLGYFKYSAFFVSNVAALAGTDWTFHAVLLPLAISFFTFQQIALLVDVYSEDTEVDRFLDYCAFVSFFPQLIAGPIVLHREMSSQIEALRENRNTVSPAVVAGGLLVFSFGLFKKVCLADPLGQYTGVVFGAADSLTMLEAWYGAIAFMVQIYFDFSGYSDMAIGLALLFGIQLPLNFNQPYRACSFIEYWKRWHMTMTRFFMLYVYAPIALGFGRRAAVAGLSAETTFLGSVIAPTVVTFVLAGLWHGAGWTFVVFGLLNGVFLSANHLWQRYSKVRVTPALGWALTMFAVLITLVYFRAPSIEAAHALLVRMVDPAFLVLPNWAPSLINLETGFLTLFPSGGVALEMAVLLGGCCVLSVVLPNPAHSVEKIRPTFGVAIATAFLFLVSIGFLDRPQEFIYFQF